MPTAQAVPLGFSEGGSAPFFAQAKTDKIFVGTFLRIALGNCAGRGYDLISPGVALLSTVQWVMMEEFLKELRTKVWRTAGARYDAARRLKRREIVSTISLTFFSALTVVLAFVQRVYVQQAGTAFDNYLTALSVCLGIFLLAISLIEWGAGAGSKAEALHRNAEDLTALQILIWQRISEVESGKVGKWSDVDDLRTEYERIKERCIANHDPLDDKTFLAHNRMAPEFLDKDKNPKIGSVESYWITSRNFMTSLWYFAAFWLLILIALWNIPWPAYT